MKKLFRYGISGAVNTVITYAMFVVLSDFINYRIAIIIVYIFGIALSFVLQGRYVFRVQGSILRFIAVYLLMLVVNLSVTAGLVELAHWPKELAQLVAIGCVVILGFLMSKHLVFNNKATFKGLSASMSNE
jgi:putative flippase GtrA